jgi:AmiR/NasT family two-component response regulator
VEIALLSGINFVEERLKQEIHFRTRIDTSLKIEKAKGILQERYRLTSQQAEHTLRQVSVKKRMRLYRLAEIICDNAEISYQTPDDLTLALRNEFEKPLDSVLKG